MKNEPIFNASNGHNELCRFCFISFQIFGQRSHSIDRTTHPISLGCMHLSQIFYDKNTSMYVFSKINKSQMMKKKNNIHWNQFSSALCSLQFLFVRAGKFFVVQWTKRSKNSIYSRLSFFFLLFFNEKDKKETPLSLFLFSVWTFVVVQNGIRQRKKKQYTNLGS